MIREGGEAGRTIGDSLPTSTSPAPFGAAERAGEKRGGGDFRASGTGRCCAQWKRRARQSGVWNVCRIERANVRGGGRTGRRGVSWSGPESHGGPVHLPLTPESCGGSWSGDHHSITQINRPGSIEPLAAHCHHGLSPWHAVPSLLSPLHHSPPLGTSLPPATTLGYLAPVLPPEALAEYKAALLLVRLDGALAKMAKSRYEYVKFFEKDDSLLQNTWIVVRIDGRGFHGYNHLPRRSPTRC